MRGFAETKNGKTLPRQPRSRVQLVPPVIKWTHSLGSSASVFRAFGRVLDIIRSVHTAPFQPSLGTFGVVARLIGWYFFGGFSVPRLQPAESRNPVVRRWCEAAHVRRIPWPRRRMMITWLVIFGKRSTVKILNVNNDTRAHGQGWW